MAEAVLFNLAGRLLLMIASPAIKKAFEGARSIWKASDDLQMLTETIGTIQAVLLDAEKRQESSPPVKNWITRVRNVLYKAEDLFEEVVTADLIKRKMEGNKYLRKVRISCSRLNPVIFNYSTAKSIKSVRKRLDQISKDMALFNFAQRPHEEAILGMGMRPEQEASAHSSGVFGREDEKQAILEFMFNESCVEQTLSVISIVGIGGMGKTTLAQLVFDDVQKKFDKKWWACISDVPREIDIIGRIYQSLSGKSYRDISMFQLESGIRESIKEKEKFVLVLDDLWNEDHSRGLKLRALLGGGAKGCTVIVTARSSSVSDAMESAYTHVIGGLAEEMSYCLFKSIAFRQGQEGDPIREEIGKDVVRICKNVPLAIIAVANLFYRRNSIEEWKTLKNNEISQMEHIDDKDTIMVSLKLSYYHLPSHLKHCFASCSLFPKDSRISGERLVYLWMSLGYIHTESLNGTQTLEDIGNMYFMDLWRRCLFQEVEYRDGEIISCKMHDLVYDVAKFAAGEESICLKTQARQLNAHVRHIAFDCPIDLSSKNFLPRKVAKQLRSLLVHGDCLTDSCALHKRIKKFRFLRTLDLHCQGIQIVPKHIGDLIHLRVLNLSENKFIRLPDCITKLLNLLILDLSGCAELTKLPDDFRKLVSLTHLHIKECDKLMCMPPRFGELTSLQSLTDFVVVKSVDEEASSRLDALAGLNLKGSLSIRYRDEIDAENEAELIQEIPQLSAELKKLSINAYPGMGMPTLPAYLVHLELSYCRHVQVLPPLHCSSFIKYLDLSYMERLEYIQDEDSTLYFPCLEELQLLNNPNMKEWSRNGAATNESFPSLRLLYITACPQLKSIPTSPSLQEISVRYCYELENIDGEALYSLWRLEIEACSELKSVHLPPVDHNVLQVLNISACKKLVLWEEVNSGEGWDSLLYLQDLGLYDLPMLKTLCVESLTYLQHVKIHLCNGLTDVRFPPPHLNAVERLMLWRCSELELKEDEEGWASLINLERLDINGLRKLETLHGAALTSLNWLSIFNCDKLKRVYLPQSDVNAVKSLLVGGCSELEMWDEDTSGVDWHSLVRLRYLRTRGMQRPERLPHYLQQRGVEHDYQ